MAFSTEDMFRRFMHTDSKRIYQLKGYANVNTVDDSMKSLNLAPTALLVNLYDDVIAVPVEVFEREFVRY